MKQHKNNTQELVVNTINKIATFVIPTYGKNGRGVLIDNGFETSVIDDGFLILENLEFEDPFENAVLNFVRETTRKTNKRAGDGTTTSIVLLHAIMNEVQKENPSKEKLQEIIADFKKALVESTKFLREKASQILTLEELTAVAKVSFNNEKIASLIAEIVYKTGIDGVVNVEESELMESSIEVKSGFHFDKGYVSSYMVTNNDYTAELKNPLVFITEDTISKVATILPLLEEAYKNNRALLIVGEVIGEALQNILVNKIKGRLQVVVVSAPINKGFFEDVSLLTNAIPFSVKKGDTVAKVEMCGEIERCIVTNEHTTLIGAVPKETDKLQERLTILKEELEKASGWEADQLKKRIGGLQNQVGIVSIGAMTDGERRYIKAKTDDAVHATKLAFKSGVVRGGGVEMANITTGTLLDVALKAPQSLIGDVSDEVEVYDPVEVNIASIESAVSIACTLLSSEGIITVKND